MNALALRPSNDEDAQRLIGVLNEERRLPASKLMPRIGIFPDVVGVVSADVKLLHVVQRANRSIGPMGFSIGRVGTGLGAEYWIGKHSRSS